MAYGYTVAQARAAIARLLHDFLELRLTEATAEAIIKDSRRLLYPDNTFAGTWGVIVDAVNTANEGHLFRVVSSSQSATSIQFLPDAPATHSVGDTVQLVNISGQGWTPDLYLGAINDTLEEAFPDYTVPDVYPNDVEDAVVFDFRNPRVTLPDDWYFVYEVEVYDGYTWHRVDPLWWRTQMATAEVVFDGLRTTDMMHNRQLKFFGTTKHPTVTEDSDTISLKFDYLTYAAAAKLASYKSNNRERLQAAGVYMQKADLLRPSAMVVPSTNVRRVRW